MATGERSEVRKQEEDSRHTCGLCKEPYGGRSPKLLPCFHTFCLPCLTALSASVTSVRRPALTEDDPTQTEAQQQPLQHAKGDGVEGDVTTVGDDVTARQDDVSTGSFLCPSCQAPVLLTEGGVEALMTNFYVDHAPGPKEDVASVLCDMCEEDHREHATHACHRCRMNMCRTCRRYHDIMARDHHVTPVGLGQPAQEGEKTGLCMVHQDQTLCFYCRQCDVSICLHCKVTSHDGHETVDLASATFKAREEITSLIPTVQQQLQVIQMSMQQADREERELTRHVQEVTQQIHARCDVLMTWARQSHNQLMDQVTEKEACARSQLHAEKSASTLALHTLSTLLARAARATAADPDVLVWRKELKAALLSEDELDQRKQRADRQGRSWTWEYDVTDAGVLQEDDVRAYFGRVAEGAEAEVSRAPVSVRELADRVEHLVKEMTSCANDVTQCQGDITKLQQTDKELEQKGSELEKRGEDLQKTTASLQDEITTSRKTEAALQDEITTSRKTTASLQDEITTLRKTEADLKKTTQDVLENLDKRKSCFTSKGCTKPHSPGP